MLTKSLTIGQFWRARQYPARRACKFAKTLLQKSTARMAIQAVPKKERTVGKYIIIIVICSKKCPVLYKTGKNCIKINKKRYRFCSLCRLVSSELDDASSKKNQKRTQLGHMFTKNESRIFKNWKLGRRIFHSRALCKETAQWGKGLFQMWSHKEFAPIVYNR